MLGRPYKLAVVCVLAISTYAACRSPEQEASDALARAAALLQAEDWIELQEQLDKITTEYPGTQAAVKAEEMHAEMVASANRIAEDALKSALATSVRHAADHPDDTLDIEKLHELGFETAEGVEIEFLRPEADDFLITAEHVAGDRVFTVGRDGVISSSPK